MSQDHRGGLLRACGAFTLVEVLVVITIIMLLVSVLLPALAAARKHARTTLCVTNVRSIAQAGLVYSVNYKDILPGGYQWQYKLKPFLAQQIHGDAAMTGANKSNMPRIYFCPEERLPFPATTGYAEEFTTYGVNGVERAGTFGGSIVAFGGSIVAFGVFGGRTNVARLLTPSQTWGVVDSLHYDEMFDEKHQIMTDALSLPPGTPMRMLAGETKGRRQYRSSMSFPHPGKSASMAYMDGHCATRQAQTATVLPVSDYPNAPFWAYRWGSFSGLQAAGFDPELAIPSATEDPNLWGLPTRGTFRLERQKVRTPGLHSAGLTKTAGHVPGY